MKEGMENFKQQIRNDELIRGSFVLIVMLGLFNLFNYLFQISMARFLGPVDYGTFAVLMSLLYIFGIPSEAIQTVITKYTSKFNSEGNNGKIKDLLYRSLRKGWIMSVVLFVIFIPVAFVLSYFLNIRVWLIILTGAFLFYSFTIPMMRGVLQGKKKFMAMGTNLVVESSTKFVLAVILVFIGFRVYGAIGGLMIGCLITFLVAFMPVKDVIRSKRVHEGYENIFSYSLPILIAITSIVLIYSLDVIIARLFFSPEMAGQYAFVALIAKTILFSSFAIGKAMFPISSERFEKNGETKSLFKKSVIITCLIAAVALVAFFFFPKQIIHILSLGDLRYLGASGILFISGLSFSFASLSYILILYNISINKMKKSSFGLLIFVVLEVVLLSIFNSSLREFAFVLMLINLAMLIYNIWITKK